MRLPMGAPGEKTSRNADRFVNRGPRPPPVVPVWWGRTSPVGVRHERRTSNGGRCRFSPGPCGAGTPWPRGAHLA
jgi:hypothetical protein